MRNLYPYLLFVVFGIAFGQQPSIQPFRTLRLPFEKGTKFVIAEGWTYSPEENAIHGYQTHYGIDFDCAAGTKLYMPVDGYVLQSFQTFTLPRTWKGKDVGFGLGHFVQILVPNGEYFVQLGHMRKVQATIPYHEPRRDAHGNYVPPSEIIATSGLIALSNYRFMKRGELIGEVGTSGLTWGYVETPTVRPKQKSWDNPHVHVEVFRRTPKGGKDSEQRWDPYGWYGRRELYQNGANVKRSIFITDDRGMPLFVR